MEQLKKVQTADRSAPAPQPALSDDTVAREIAAVARRRQRSRDLQARTTSRTEGMKELVALFPELKHSLRPVGLPCAYAHSGLPPSVAAPPSLHELRGAFQDAARQRAESRQTREVLHGMRGELATAARARRYTQERMQHSMGRSEGVRELLGC